MSKEELILKLKKLSKETFDTESIHFEADELLLKYINDNEISDAYNSINKWYA